MKVCFPVESDNGYDSMIYNQFGPAPAFVIFDSEKNTLTGFENTNRSSTDTECDPAKVLNGQKVDAIVVNCIGSEALVKLHQLGVKVFQSCLGNIRENLAMYAGHGLTEYTHTQRCGNPSTTQASAH